MSARVGDLRYECKYINVRRWLMCLEHFIDKDARWAVFENKGAGSDGREPDSVDSFVNNEFVTRSRLDTLP